MGVNEIERKYMKLNLEKLEKECISVDGVNINIRELSKVGLIDINFRNVKITFAYLYDGGYFFMYSDTTSYKELIKEIARHKYDMRQKLLRYQHNFGVEHFLWKQLLQYTCKKFRVDEYTYADYYSLCKTSHYSLNGANDYFSMDYERWRYPRKVNCIKEAYDLLSSVLPKNFSKTRENYLRQEIKDKLKEFTDVCGNNLENKGNYLEKLEMLNGSSLDKWNTSKDKLQSLIAKLQGLTQEEIFDAKESSNIQLFLDYCFHYVCGRVDKLNEKSLLQQYGPISGLKIKLRESIDRLGFKELLDLYKEYKEKENLLCSKACHAGMKLNEFPYGEYIDIYRLWSILISDKMNRINKNKAENKYISQDLLDEALIFYYDTESAKEADFIRTNEKYAQDKLSGNEGEQKVDYALKWLDKSYIQIEKKSIDKVGNRCIFIKNAEFIDEQQEYDHLIVSNKGIFNIETKNYTGKLVIDQYGNWIRKRDNEEEGLKNPLQQIRQHEKILMSFLPENCKVISIICIANDKAIIEGSENCPIPIIKSDMLVEYIENYNEVEAKISDLQVKQCVNAIYSHMVQ
ncbi:nuclease-related domain-containing protein [Campylobacter devanensis]|uniref:nuclease-related domain-containing protein n=1 Tax=Campylobacter devanensis TaxID=3161138 RepID=UPI00112F5FF9|nr:nuclease-related domain-containing protein [Campylobacter sp. P093]